MVLCCRCLRVCKLVMFMVGVATISVTGILLYHTFSTLRSSVNVCTLWLDMAGRLSLFVICYYVAGLCGCMPLPDICRPKWFPEPFFVWKWCTRCSRCPKICARLFRIHSCRTRTISRTPLLKDPSHSPEVSQWRNSLPVASLCGSNKPDYNAERPAIEIVSQLRHPELRIFQFDETQFNSSSESSSSLETDEHPKDYKRCSIAKGHPMVPWGLLELHKTVRRWGSDPSTINKAFRHMIERFNNGNRRVRCNSVPVHEGVNPIRTGFENSFDSKGLSERHTPPKTNSKQDTRSFSIGHGDLGSPKTPKLDTSEDVAPGQEDPIRQELVQFPDPSDSEGICVVTVKSISPEASFKLDTNEGAAIGVCRYMQQTPVSDPDSVAKDESDTVPRDKNSTDSSSSNVDTLCSKNDRSDR